MDALVGKWQLAESDNFDGYLKEVGVGLIQRKVANSAKPVVEISKEGDHYIITTTTSLKSSAIKFKLGEETPTTTLDDREMKSTFNFEGNKLIQLEKPVKDSDKASRFERYVDGGKLIVTIESGNVKCRRVYNKA